MGLTKKQFSLVWLFACPIAFSPLLFLGPEYRCIFSIIIVSSFWMLEVVPIGITSLLPLFLFPILNIDDVEDVAKTYFKDSVVLFMCTLVMAMAVEETGLHRRIALKLLSTVGARKQTMLMGFMFTTAFISFFVSDTACTALMLPIAMAIITTMYYVTDNTVKQKCEDVEDVKSLHEHKEFCEIVSEMTPEDQGFAKALVLSCAHGSLIGGTAIITSTGPNLVFREQLQTYFPEHEVSVSYLQWMMFAMPPMVFYLLSSYIVLSIVFMGPLSLVAWLRKPTEEEERVDRIVSKSVKEAYRELGDMTFGEKSVMSMFILLISCWIFRDPGFMPGWKLFFPDNGKRLSDAVPGILIVFILFVWPRDPFNGNTNPILNWKAMKNRYSWSCQLLIGAGYAISQGVQKSGLSKLISCHMYSIFNGLQSVVLQIVVTTSICFMTEFASNVSTGSIFIPIVMSIADSLHIHPLYLALPTTIACSFAFMLPMATPPNAVVYDTRIVSMFEMISTGVFLNCFCIIITVINMNTWTWWLFDLSTVPTVIGHQNITMNC